MSGRCIVRQRPAGSKRRSSRYCRSAAVKAVAALVDWGKVNMVKLFPIKTLVPVNILCVEGSTSAGAAPNRFTSGFYDRPFGSDDCTKETGKCSCHMCCDTPLVIAACGDPICDRFNITLRSVQEYLDGGLLRVQNEEALMIYRQIKSDGTAQVAIFAAIDVDDCAKRIVRPHEKVTCDSDITVLNQKKKVPQSHMDPVMLLYRENASVDAIVKRIMDEDEPLRSTGSESFRADSHCIWAVKRPEDIIALQRAFESVDSLYIADGHHRTAASCKESLKLTAGKCGGVNVARSSRFLTALIFPASHLSVLSYNRCVRRLPENVSPAELLDRISTAFDVRKLLPGNLSLSDMALDGACSPDSVSGRKSAGFLQPLSPRSSSVRPSAFVADDAAVDFPSCPTEQDTLYMYVSHAWYCLRARHDDVESETCKGNPLQGIGCQILLDRILNPIFSMNVAGNDNSMIYVDGREGASGVKGLIDHGDAAVGFLVSRVPTEDIMRVADAGQLLPAKATFFDPKPMSNMLLRLIR